MPGKDHVPQQFYGGLAPCDTAALTALHEKAEKFKRENAPLTKKDGEKILEALAGLERKIDLIFGDAVVIKGRLVSLGSLLK